MDHVAIDLGSRKSQICVRSSDGQIVDERRWETWELQRVLEPGRFRATIGGSQPDARSAELTGQSPLAIEFDVVG